MPDTRIENLNVLLVDDETSFLDFLEALLRYIGISNIARASSGREAYAKLYKSERVTDCILCDIAMEDGNGLQLLHAVRTGQVPPVRPDACFLLLTASGEHENVAVAGSLDVSGYIVKPATAEKLRTAIVKGRARPIRIDFNRYNQVVLPRK